jgi:hypothetical protein
MITRAQFNEQYKDHKFVKLTYETGLNIDHLEFNPTGECKPGGIFFTDQNKLCIGLEM